ncbi:hypothetical protein NEDG_00295 [Nematocida displodere]|uniref:Uncharacterized protein n=1 Tax=Nematocida displodere TaxID=1805483 RepID=A0A177EKC5_9MICR|nr:hypothetical protein NEDG_00295 [Nematocida displodere]
MCECAKSAAIRKTLLSIEEVAQEEEKSFLLAELTSEIEYSSRDELWMVLSLIKDSDKTEDGRFLRRTLAECLKTSGEVVRKYYAVFQSFIEAMHAEYCGTGQCAGVPCSVLIARTLSHIIRDTNRFPREMKKQMYSTNALSLDVIGQCIVASHREGVVYTEVFSPLFQMHRHTASLKAVEVIGALLVLLPAREVGSLLFSQTGREDSGSLLRSAAYLAQTARHEGLSPKVCMVLGQIGGKTLHQALKKSSRSKTVAQGVYVLVYGLLYLVGQEGVGLEEVSAGIGGIVAGTTVHAHLFASMSVILEVAKSTPKFAEIASVGVASFLKSQAVCTESMEMLQTIVEAPGGQVLVPEQVGRVLGALARDRTGKSVGALQALKKRYGTDRECSDLGLWVLRGLECKRVRGQQCEYFGLLDKRCLSEEESAALRAKMLGICRTAPFADVAERCFSGVFVFDGEGLISLVEVFFERARGDERFLRLVVRLLSAQKGVYLPSALLREMPAVSRYAYHILRLANVPELALEAFREGLHYIRTASHFANGTCSVFYGVTTFYEETRASTMEILGEMGLRVQRREMVDYSYVFKTLGFLIGKLPESTPEVAQSLRQIYAQTTGASFILWIYRERALSAALPDLLEMVRAGTTLPRAQQLVLGGGTARALDYISTSTSVKMVVMACREILEDIGADLALQTPRVANQTLSYILEVVSNHSASVHLNALLGALSQGTKNSKASYQTKRAVVGYILGKVEEATPEAFSVLSSTLDVAGSVYARILQIVTPGSLVLTKDALQLVGKLLKESRTLGEVSALLDAVDALYSSQERLGEAEHAIYLKLKILENRMYQEPGPSTVSLVLKKLGAEGIPNRLMEKVYELFTATHISTVSVIKAIDSFTPGKKGTHFKRLSLFLSSSTHVPEPYTLWDVIETKMGRNCQPLRITSALTVFVPENEVRVRAEYTELVKEHCSYMYGGDTKTTFVKQVMVFFVKESPCPVISAFAGVCDGSIEVLSEMFPLALLAGIEGLSTPLKNMVIGGIERIIKRSEHAQKSIYALTRALEYLLVHSLEGSPENKTICAFLSPQVGYRHRRLATDQEKLGFLYASLQYGSVEETRVFLRHLKTQLLPADSLLAEPLETLGLELSGRFSGTDLSVFGARRKGVETVGAIRAFGEETDTLMGEQGSGAMQRIIEAAQSTLSSWDTPTDFLLKEIYKSTSEHGCLAAIREAKERVAGSLYGAATPESLRIFSTLNGYQSAKKEQFMTQIRNEILANTLQYSNRAGGQLPSKGVFASIFQVALSNDDLPLARGTIALEVSSGGKQRMAEAAVAHFARTLGTRKELEERCAQLFRKDADRHPFISSVCEQAKTLRKWSGGLFHRAAPAKKKLEGLKEMSRVRAHREDPLLFLAILQSTESHLKDREFASDARSFVEETDPALWMPFLHEVFLVQPALRFFQPYLDLVDKLYEHHAEKVSSMWAHFTPASEQTPGQGPDHPFGKLEKNNGFIRHVQFIEMVNELAETPNERLLQELKRFKETEKRGRTLQPSESLAHSLQSQEGVPSLTQRNIHRFCQILTGFAFVLKHRTECPNEAEALEIVRSLLELAATKKKCQVWETLFLNKINKIFTAFPPLPKALELSKAAATAIAGMLLPGSAQRVSSISCSVPVIPSAQRPRKLSLHSEGGTTHHYLIKKEKDIAMERAISQCLASLNAPHTTTHEILSTGVAISGYIEESLSLKEAILEIREDREAELGARPASISKKERDAISYLCQDYNSLRELEKLEVYQKAANHPAREIKDWIAKYSQSIPAHFARMDTFTSTYLYSSAAAYLIGLGDRHPGNILLLFSSSLAMHIDYTDALDTLQTRKHHQERVPTRLTPMITTAIGPCVEEHFLIALKEAFRAYRGSFYTIDSIFALFFGSAAYRRLTLANALGHIEQKVPLEEAADEEGRRIFWESTAAENLAQMYIGWMPFW